MTRRSGTRPRPGAAGHACVRSVSAWRATKPHPPGVFASVKTCACSAMLCAHRTAAPLRHHVSGARKSRTPDRSVDTAVSFLPQRLPCLHMHSTELPQGLRTLARAGGGVQVTAPVPEPHRLLPAELVLLLGQPEGRGALLLTVRRALTLRPTHLQVHSNVQCNHRPFPRASDLSGSAVLHHSGDVAAYERSV